MLKIFSFFLLALFGAAAHAGLLESDWGPNQGENGGQLVFAEGHLNLVSPAGGNASRKWAPGVLTFSSNWTIEAQVHLSDLNVQVSEVVTIGFAVHRAGDPFTVAAVELRDSGTFGRFASMHYRTGPLNGGSDDQPTEATDAVLALTYSVSERVLRSSYSPLGGVIEEIHAASIDVSGVELDEPLQISFYGLASRRSVVIANAYLKDIAILVPEPMAAAWLGVILLYRLRWRQRRTRS